MIGNNQISFPEKAWSLFPKLKATTILLLALLHLLPMLSMAQNEMSRIEETEEWSDEYLDQEIQKKDFSDEKWENLTEELDYSGEPKPAKEIDTSELPQTNFLTAFLLWLKF